MLKTEIRYKNTKNKKQKVRSLQLLRGVLATLDSLLGEKVLVDVGKNTTLGNGDVSEKLVQLLVVANSELQVTGDDTGLLIVTGSVTGQLEDFGSEVLENGGEVDGSTSTNTLSIIALPQETVNTTHGESKTSLSRAALRSLAAARLAASRFSSGRHIDCRFEWSKAKNA